MTVIINETGERTELSALDRESGCEWTADLIDFEDDIIYDDEEEAYHISQDKFDFWEEYIINMVADSEDRNKLEEKYGSTNVFKIYNYEWISSCNYAEHHDNNLRAAERCKEELKPIADEDDE